MSEIELKACPFCGADGEWLSTEHLEGTIRHPAYCIRCERCGASSRYTDHDCREVWNERAPQWRPIESAPKDGTRVLLWDSAGDGRAITGAWRVDSADDHETFTHWQPLPAPPEVSDGQ